MFVLSLQTAIILVMDELQLLTVKVCVCISDVDSVTRFPKKLIQNRLWPSVLLALCSLRTEKQRGPDMQGPETLQHYCRQPKPQIETLGFQRTWNAMLLSLLTPPLSCHAGVCGPIYISWCSFIYNQVCMQATCTCYISKWQQDPPEDGCANPSCC